MQSPARIVLTYFLPKEIKVFYPHQGETMTDELEVGVVASVPSVGQFVWIWENDKQVKYSVVEVSWAMDKEFFASPSVVHPGQYLEKPIHWVGCMLRKVPQGRKGGTNLDKCECCGANTTSFVPMCGECQK